MKYQNDAHHYRGVVRKRRRIQSAKGVSLLVISLALMFYAVPGFAVSVFDYGSSDTASSTSFTSEINDAAPAAENATAALAADAAAEGTQDAQAASADEGAVSPAYAVSDYSVVSSTTGPGALSNKAAVSAAKTRSQALAAVADEQAQKAASSTSNTFVNVGGTSVEQRATYTNPIDIVFATIALIAGVICATLGIRMLVRAHRMRGMQITAAFGSALRA